MAGADLDVACLQRMQGSAHNVFTAFSLQVLSGLPKPIGSQLPHGAQRAAQHLLRPASNAPNDLK